MSDEVLESIRAVTDRAMEQIAPESSLVAQLPDPRGKLLLDSLAARVDPGGVDLSGARLRTLRRSLLKLIRPSTETQWAFNADVHRALSEAMANIRAERSSLDAVRAGLASLEMLSDVSSSRLGDLEEALTEAIDRLQESMAFKVDIEPIHAMESRQLEALDEMRGAVGHQSDRLDGQTDRLEGQSNRLEKQSDRLKGQSDRLEGQSDRLDGLVAAVDSMALELQRSRGELSRHRAVVDLALRELRSSVPTGGPDIAAVTRPLDESYDTFYEDFESVFRGTREQVMDRQRDYVELVADLPGPVLDVGPGRGEWLELLNEVDISASGVDTNGQFVAGCRDRGLEVIHGDAFDHLRSVPEASLGAVTAFQVVEHLPFENLVDLLGLCLVAIRPGGVLILETPNPSNLKVGAMSFWTDPSHVHPLPPHMLEFLVQWRGFVDVRVQFPSAETPRELSIDGVSSSELDDLNWAMFGPEDYAIVARRP